MTGIDNALELRHLRYFVALCQELNFGRAAQRLHIAQPPLSRQIRQLEALLGIELFARNRHGVTLTDAGAALLPHAQATLEQARRTIETARAQRAGCAAPRREFVVGYTTVVDREAIPDVLAPLQQRFPDWRVLGRGMHSIRLVREIARGTIAAAFIGLHTDAGGLKVEALLAQPPVLALPADHRLARRRSIGLTDLAGEPIFWSERRLNPGFYDYFQDYFARIGFSLTAIAEPADHHVLLGLIAAGRGIAFIPASLQKVRRQGVVFRPLKSLPEPPLMGLAVAYAPDNDSPLLPALLELARAQVAAGR